VPFGGRWEESLNSDAVHYGGAGWGNYGAVNAEPVPQDNLAAVRGVSRAARNRQVLHLFVLSRPSLRNPVHQRDFNLIQRVGGNCTKWRN